MHAPLTFSSEFKWGRTISEKIRLEGYSVPQYSISLNGKDLVKPYQDQFISDRVKKNTDTVKDVCVKSFFRGDVLSAIVWYARTSFFGTIMDNSIEEYIKLPVALFGRGNFFVLRASGESMINAGIDDGDLVVVRQQNTADYNQIVVALVDDEATLKRFCPADDHIVLHAENPTFDDIIVDHCIIQGVAVKVIKDLA